MKKITTIILDLGAVVLNLDQDKTFNSFKKMGIDLEDMNTSTSLLNDFEKGLIPATDFIQAIRTALKGEVSDDDINMAWNEMLLDLPEERISIIKALKNNFTILLLSNTNSIHIDFFNRYFEQHHHQEKWNTLFDKIYYSYEMGMRKPDAEIYEFVLNDQGLHGSECIFIDDNKKNLEGAASCGIHTIWAKDPLSENTVKEMNELITAFRVSVQ